MNPPNEPVTIIGIDCATELNKVGVAVGVSAAGSVRVHDVFRGNDKDKLEIPPNKKVHVCDLAKYLMRGIDEHSPVLLALDAPLGWPEDMRTKEFTNHKAGKHLTTRRGRMFSRETDRVVRCQTGKKPFDVGADKIAHVAHWTLDLLKQLRRRPDHEVPLAWNPKEVSGVTAIEVYPALALLALAPPTSKDFGKGYKKKKEVRRIIWERLSSRVDGLGPPPDTDHEIDAVLCVQIAHEFLLGSCVKPTAEFPADVLRQEGWIWFSEGACKKK